MRFLWSIVLLGSLFNMGMAQHILPAKGEVFRDDVLPSVFITIHPDSLHVILEYDNRFSNHEFPANFVFDNGTVRDSVTNVGFRLRGNTSRSAQKKSFKVSFNSFVSGQKFYGLEKMNINGEHNDPSITRSKLCFDMLSYLEVPASRANHIKLYINGDYYGLYVNVEHYDEEFTKSRFDGQGNLYKCTYGADLSYKGASPSNYMQPYYELHNPNSPTAYQDLATFIDVLNNTPSADFECELEHIFNVNSYLKCIIMDVLTGNWDGPNYNINNFYLYFNSSTGQFEYIPFDLDNTFGIDWFGKDWSTQNIYNWSKSGSNSPLYTKILARPNYANRFTYLLEKTLSEYFNTTAYSSKLATILTNISSAANADTFKNKDYGYTQNDFINSYNNFKKDHVKYGLQDFVTRRFNSATAQLQTVTAVGAPPYWHSVNTDFTTDSISFELHAKGNSEVSHILLTYNWGSQSAIWTDTLKPVNNSGTYRKKIAWHPAASDVAYHFQIVTQDKIVIDYPICNMFESTKSRTGISLYINELMADNATTFYDENGLYEDWIELYYNGETPLNLSDFYITDDLSNAQKYRLPDVIVAANSYTIIWADNVGLGKHASFKLAKSGESVAIFDKFGALIDNVVFGAQDEDVSYGRQKDGELPWILFTRATPMASNNENASLLVNLSTERVVYPNPTSGRIYLSNMLHNAAYKVLSSTGNILLEGTTSATIDLGDLTNGMYLIQFTKGEVVKTEKVILLK